MKIRLNFAFLLVVIIGISSCSQYSNSFISRNYHNMAARYNCYFLAKERMITVDDKIIKNYKDDYNYILPFFPPLDTNFSSSLQSDLDYIFEKGRIPLDKHKNSEWIAESYNIIGKSKWYGNKLDTAIYVYKYVIAKTSDLPGRQMAQISLVRVYLSQKDFSMAEDELKALEKQKIFPENQSEYDLALIEYYYNYRLFEKMLPHLESLLALEKKKDRRARLNFIIGQIHQRLGNNEEAYTHYRKSLKRNPPYDIEFNAKLNISQVTNIESKDQIKKTNKTYDKMISDDKNKDLLSRVYYERANFELKRGNISKAVIYLNKSLEAPSTSTEQKAYPYYLLGKLHYEKIDTLPTKVDKYTAAKLYYDSTVTSMNPNFENAEAIIERQVILSEFVKQLEIVETEKRLQNWATLSPEELEKEVALKMKQDKEKLERERAMEESRIQKEKENIATIDDISAPEIGKAVFFAYDPVAVATQRVKFNQKWGGRPLEDNWRRSDKERIEPTTTLIQPKDSLSVEITDSSISQNDTTTQEIILDKNTYTEGIPKDDKDLKASNEKLMEATYQLGKIYYYDLIEINNAKEVFIDYLARFPDTKYEAEVIYFMYLICQKDNECKSSTYKDLEAKKYPNSLFYKLMENKDYLSENEEENRVSHAAYESAFDLYKQGQYLSCNKILDQIKIDNPKTDILDKVEFLKIMTYAQTDQVAKYYTELEKFVTDFGTSPIKNHALEILSAKPKNIDEIKIKDYARIDSMPHFFVGVFKYKEMPFSEIDKIYLEFRKNYFKEIDLSTKTVEFSDSTYLYVNKSFVNFDTAKDYYDKLMHFHEFGGHLEKVDYSYYLVTEENYKKLIATRDINEFKVFYQGKYNGGKRQTKK